MLKVPDKYLCVVLLAGCPDVKKLGGNLSKEHRKAHADEIAKPLEALVECTLNKLGVVYELWEAPNPSKEDVDVRIMGPSNLADHKTERAKLVSLEETLSKITCVVEEYKKQPPANGGHGRPKLSDIRDVVHKLLGAEIGWRDWKLLTWKDTSKAKKRSRVVPIVVSNLGNLPTLVLIVNYLGCNAMKAQVGHILDDKVWCITSK